MQPLQGITFWSAQRNLQSLRINSNSSETSESVKSLGIEIHNHLNFETFLQSVRLQDNQKNTLSRLKFFLNEDQRNLIANSFIYSSFNYCPLIWHFCLQRSIKHTLRKLPTTKHY